MKKVCLNCGYLGEPKTIMDDLPDLSYDETDVCPECGSTDLTDKSEPEMWLSPFDTCEICSCKIKDVADYFVDGKTTHGCWALMCPTCFKRYGISIKYGLGQKYDAKTGVLLAGGPT